MRIARPVPPAVELSGTFQSFAQLSELSREISRAQNDADVAMARNLRRSRALARRETAR